MVVFNFDKGQKYEVKLLVESAGDNTVFFKDPDFSVPGYIMDNTYLYCSSLSATIISKRLDKNLQNNIIGLSGLIITQDKKDDDNYELTFVSQKTRLETMVLSSNYRVAREIACLITGVNVQHIKVGAEVQCYISLLSTLPHGRDHIKAFIEQYEDKAEVLKLNDPDYHSKLFENFVEGSMLASPHHKPTDDPEEPQDAGGPSANPEQAKLSRQPHTLNGIRTVIQNKKVGMSREAVNYLICLMTLYMPKQPLELSHYENWQNNRRKAWEGTLSLSLKPDLRLDFEFMQNFRRCVDIVTHIKPLAINILLENKGEPGIRHILDMMKFSQMTSVTFILAFVKTPKKTMAHFHDTVLEEIERFSKSLAEVKNMYKDNWHYFKFYDPTNSCFSAQKLPSLSYAAYHFQPADVIKNYQAPKTPPADAQLIKQTVKQRVDVKLALPQNVSTYKAALQEMNITYEDVKMALENMHRYNYSRPSLDD